MTLSGGETVERAVARVDLAAIERNCARLASGLTGGAGLCAVVKADAYGHGADWVAGAALAGGASKLAVVTGLEAHDLRSHQPKAEILVMGALTPAELDLALGAGAEIGVWREGFRALVAERAEALGVRARVHVKYDTGMGRLGEPDPEAVGALLRACSQAERIDLAGLWTHFATADAPGTDDGYFDAQLARFLALAEPAKAEHPGLLLHAANSAATLRDPAAHLDMVRCGIAIYGLDPFNADPSVQDLTPALTLASYVADLKEFRAGSSAGYGQRWTAVTDTNLAVLPIGYGDGLRRGLTNNAEVLIAGHRHPLVGTVSMDNVTVDLGPQTDVRPGEPAILIGKQGGERILAEEMAARLETINYEITCGLTARVRRAYHR